jgi:hypothetical protein
MLTPHQRLAARRKAERHAAKALLKPPRCAQCDAIIADAKRLATPRRWERKYCSHACRQAAYRDRHE